MEDSQFYVQNDGETGGPYTLEVVKTWYDKGELMDDAMLFKMPEGPWVSVTNFFAVRTEVQAAFMEALKSGTWSNTNDPPPPPPFHVPTESTKNTIDDLFLRSLAGNLSPFEEAATDALYQKNLERERQQAEARVRGEHIMSTLISAVATVIVWVWYDVSGWNSVWWLAWCCGASFAGLVLALCDNRFVTYIGLFLHGMSCFAQLFVWPWTLITCIKWMLS